VALERMKVSSRSISAEVGDGEDVRDDERRADVARAGPQRELQRELADVVGALGRGHAASILEGALGGDG
jgi:hypothetical protein